MYCLAIITVDFFSEFNQIVEKIITIFFLQFFIGNIPKKKKNTTIYINNVDIYMFFLKKKKFNFIERFFICYKKGLKGVECRFLKIKYNEFNFTILWRSHGI